MPCDRMVDFIPCTVIEKQLHLCMTLSSDKELKLINHLYEKIVSKEIKIFASLVEYTKKMQLSFNPDKVLLKAFLLLKEVHWGFLKEIDKSRYTKLWKELVLAHKDFTYAGDLKRNISISNIYISMLDIHGYTQFCQESKGNLSRLRKLDEFLHDGIKRIAGINSALANRERGDEIVVIAATATDSIKTTLEIINAFSKGSVIENKVVKRNRTDYSIILPDFKVTAGIAGGNLTTPLIITESGLLSGYLLNTAARLQTLANEYSPRESKIMITNSVYANFLKENKLVKSELSARKLLYFFNNGPVSFKGTKITSYEIIFKEKEKYREKYAEYMEDLFNSLKQELWKHKVFQDLMTVIIKACKHMPSFSVEIKADDSSKKISNDTLIQLCEKAALLYNREDYISAVSLLCQIEQQLEHIPDFDSLVLNYAAEVYVKYERLINIFEKKLEKEIENKIDIIFNEQYKTAYYNSKKNIDTYKKLKNHAIKSEAMNKKKIIWNVVVEENRDQLDLEIYSGKK